MQVARHVQSTKNRKLVIFLQYLKKKDIDEVYFLQADKHESFLQVDTIILVCLAEQNFACAVKFLVSQLFYRSLLMQNIQLFYKGPVMFVVTCCIFNILGAPSFLFYL